MKRRQWSAIKMVVFLTLFWTLAWLLYALSRYFGLEEEFPRLSDAEFIRHLKSALVSGTVFGVIFGLMEAFFRGRAINRRPFGQVILFKALIFIITCYVALLLIHLPQMSKSSGIFKLAESWPVLVSYSQTQSFLSFFVFSVCVNFIISIGVQINNYFSPGVLLEFVTGRYYRPRVEQRVFMFLDLTDSTSIAEQLGHVKYSALIQKCFYDMGGALRRGSARVYQYVGDEVVLTWPENKSVGDWSCITTYFDFQNKLERSREKYLAEFGVFPHFKASVNCGTVSVAEVGDIKREIAYHGDVLNTAARILGHCKTFKRDLLISEYIKEKLGVNDGYDLEDHGPVSLRGKEDNVNVYSVAVRKE